MTTRKGREEEYNEKNKADNDDHKNDDNDDNDFILFQLRLAPRTNDVTSTASSSGSALDDTTTTTTTRTMTECQSDSGEAYWRRDPNYRYCCSTANGSGAAWRCLRL